MSESETDGPSDFSTVHGVFEDYFQRVERGEEPRLTDVVGDGPELLPRIKNLMTTMLRLEGVSTPGADLEQPQILGDYRIVREIGQGGMGIVYEAEQVSLGRRIALKVITTARNTSAAAVTRFRREAAVASRLDHPGLCAVYDAGTEDGTPYIAMAFVQGRTLAQIVKIRQSDLITPETIMDRTGMLRIVEDVARALHHAHECGVIHRDVKPANIMIRQDGSPVVLDFGLARSLDDGDPTLTLTGDVLGTPAYMSPEQLRGEPTDRRCDVWALGVILY
ncbi:MAG: serine/threonine protein kinase [Planctomycetes bacterium]|nr:serine/threonine protein kinase [Planctomycetota bacterium]